MKLNRTKNAMFYERTKMVDELKTLIERHRVKYNQDPKRIYVLSGEWDLYEQELSSKVRYNYSASGYPRIKKSLKPGIRGKEGIVALSFQGIPVVRIDDWRMLSKKRK